MYAAFQFMATNWRFDQAAGTLEIPQLLAKNKRLVFQHQQVR
jgi:hypothetical protein